MITTVLAACTTFDFSTCSTIRNFLDAAINSINAVAIILAILFLGIGGIKYITATGNKEKAGEAKQLLTQVLIGLAVVLGINVIMSVLFNLVGSGNQINTPAMPKLPGASSTS